MTEKKPVALSDEQMWRLARDSQVREAPPDEAEEAALLAAYIEGNLDLQTEDAVERWLAGDAAAGDTAVSARQAVTEPPGPVPDAVVARAQGLVRAGQPTAEADKDPGWLAQVFGALPTLWQPAGLVTATALLVACLAGFQLGKSGYHGLVAFERVLAQEAGLGIESDDLL